MRHKLWLIQLMVAAVKMQERWQFESALGELLGVPE